MPLFQRRKLIQDDPNRPLGLVVPPRQLVIWHPKTGELLYDGIAEMEYEYRMKGRPDIVFEEDDGPPNIR